MYVEVSLDSKYQSSIAAPDIAATTECSRVEGVESAEL
jgi:hypothetical protein